MEDLQALTEIQNQISQLQMQEKKIRAAHLATVISDMNQKIAAYGLTPADLKFKSDAPKAETPKATKKAVVKYRDGSGNTWSGRGLKPKWLATAIANGAQLTEFEA
jgi:DNA-binding protein H-NS